MGIVPPRRSGKKESAAHTPRVSSTEPKILTAPASNSSERIHFHDNTKASSGNRKAAAPKVCRSTSASQAPG